MVLQDDNLMRRILGNKEDYQGDFTPRDVIKYFNDTISRRVKAGAYDSTEGYHHVVSVFLLHYARLKGRSSSGSDGPIVLLNVAAKLAFDGRIQGAVLTEILNEIVRFRFSLKNYFFGVWRIGCNRVFDGRDESVRAFEYYVSHATAKKLYFPVNPPNIKPELIDEDGHRTFRLVEFPIDFFGFGRPVSCAVLENKPDVLLVLLRHGARLLVNDQGHAATIDKVVKTLFRSIAVRGSRQKPMSEDAIACLKLVFRAVPQVRLKLRRIVGETAFRSLMAAWPMLPPNRCGLEPPELKHLARCEVREALNRNWKLPAGIQELEVPESVKAYLDLGED